MIRKATTLILGAGASMPYGFPSGKALMQQIHQSLMSNGYAAALQLGFDRQEITAFGDSLRLSAQPSVDAFLERKPRFTRLGKALIAQQLIHREVTESLFRPDPSWYEYLLNRMETSFDDFANNALSVITFNYDRSLEQFLFTALCNRYDRSPKEVGAKLRQIPIVHVHGQLGLLDWQSDDRHDPRVRAYEPNLSPGAIETGAQGIKIMSEDVDNTGEFGNARRLVLEAKRVYFLGCAYHADNMRRLRLPLKDSPDHDGSRMIAGTCWEFTEPERIATQERYKGLTLGNTYHKTYQFLRHDDSFLREE